MVPRAKAFQRLVLILGHSCGNAGVVVGPASTPLGSPDFPLPITGRLICYPRPERGGDRAGAHAAQCWCCSREVSGQSPWLSRRWGESQQLAHSERRV